MADNSVDPPSIPPVWLDPADVGILSVFRRRGPTYHINVSKTLDEDIRYVSRRCKDLAGHGLLERRGRTYYALTDRGERLLERASTGAAGHPGYDDSPHGRFDTEATGGS